MSETREADRVLHYSRKRKIHAVAETVFRREPTPRFVDGWIPCLGNERVDVIDGPGVYPTEAAAVSVALLIRDQCRAVVAARGEPAKGETS